MVSKIAHKLSYAPNFINYTYREEMVGDGIIRMFKALTTKKYDRVKGTNPFSYFTRIAFNAFRNRIKKEKHLREIHEKYQAELMLFSENYNTIVKNNQTRILKDRNHE
jgi:DNA-directed RNA polymerase specialized sigma24 family protein